MHLIIRKSNQIQMKFFKGDVLLIILKKGLCQNNSMIILKMRKMFHTIKMISHANEKYCLIESIDWVKKTIPCYLKIKSTLSVIKSSKILIIGKIRLKDLMKTDMTHLSLRRFKKIG